MANNALEDFRCFPGITEAWELNKTGLVMIGDEMYRLELWHSYSNPDIRYYVSIYTQQDGVWKRMPDPPFPVALGGDEAMHRHGLSQRTQSRLSGEPAPGSSLPGWQEQKKNASRAGVLHNHESSTCGRVTEPR